MEQANSNYDLANLLIDRSIDSIIAFNMEGAIIAWNKVAATIYGASKEQVIGKNIKEAIEELNNDPETMDAIDTAMKGMKSFVPASPAFPYRSHAETHFIPLSNKDGIRIGVMQIIHDVSHRIKAERELARLNEMMQIKNVQLQRTVDELATFTMISTNSVKAPIRLLYTDVEYLIKVEANKLSDTGKGAFRRMQSSLNRMSLLLDDMLKLAEISIAVPSDNINLDKVLASVLKELEKKITEANAKVEADGLCNVTGDEKLLKKLFFQILDNAIKFNEDAVPKIVVACEEVEIDQHFELNKGSYFKVSFTDNGIGISAADIERVFNLFEKLNEPGKYRGSGLGLTLAKKIMHAHGGSIEIESVLQKGITCNCYFPVHKEIQAFGKSELSLIPQPVAPGIEHTT